MSPNTKKSMGATAVLVLLGMLVLIAGDKWLGIMIPAAILVWFAASPTLRSGRN